jgi:hypothetical protein
MLASRTIISTGSSLPAATPFELCDHLFLVDIGKRCRESFGRGAQFGKVR